MMHETGALPEDTDTSETQINYDQLEDKHPIFSVLIKINDCILLPVYCCMWWVLFGCPCTFQ